MASNKRLEDLLKYDITKPTDSYEDVCQLIEKVDIESEKDDSHLKKAFQIAQHVLGKVFEENRLSLELFEQEVDKAAKKGLLTLI